MALPAHLGSALMACAALVAGKAEAASAQAGQPALIGKVWDCRSHDMSGLVTAYAGHGMVTATSVTVSQCGRAREEALEIWYTPAEGYRGPDTVKFQSERGAAAILKVDVR